MEQKINQTLTAILERDKNIQLVYLFGSFVKKKNRFGSDLDIAIYFKQEPDVLAIGALVIELQDAAGCKIDIVALNKLDVSNPALAYSIISEGIIVHCKDENLGKEFVRSTMLSYFDFKPIIDFFDLNFNIRLTKLEYALTKVK